MSQDSTTMKTIANAENVFNTETCNKMIEFIEVSEQLAMLEAKKTELSNFIKKQMLDNKCKNVSIADKTFIVSESVRKTATKATKEEFVTMLIGMKKQHLVHTEIEPNIDDILDSVDAGELDKAFVEKYIKITPFTTLTCK